MKDEEEISRMLASLRAVDAPEDFEGRVRSRIAERRAEPSLSRPSLFLIAKFAFPLLVLLVVGGFLILSNERELNGDLVPPVGDGTHEVAVVDDSRSASSGISNTSNLNSGVAQVPANRGGVNSRPASQGGSEDIALSADDSAVFPDGVDPRKATVSNGQPPSGGQISPTSVLSMLGVSAQCNSAGCVARTVREESLAAKAGIQNGDLISAIDGRPINSSTNIAGKFTVSELTLIRAGKRMTVSIARR
jgi:membrane-associated protease RseP (regulator of RpoE activity)